MEEVDEAIELLEKHNEWRRGDLTEMTNPTELGLAIDLIVTHYKNGRNR